MVVETGISKPKRCHVLGPIFFESAIPGVFKNDISEFTDETLDQNQSLEVILLYKLKIVNNKSKKFMK